MEIFNSKYPFMTAYLKGEEIKLVTSEHMEKLLRVTGVPEAIDVIKETDIGHFLDSVLITSFDEADRALWFYLDDCLRRIDRYDQTPKAYAKTDRCIYVKI